MTSRDERIFEEAAALWRELFREPAPAGLGGRELLELIAHNLPDPNYYDRIRSPYLRPSTITMRPRRTRRRRPAPTRLKPLAAHPRESGNPSTGPPKP